MINSNSRYANSNIVLVTDPVNNQSRLVIVPSQAIPYTFQFLFHIVTGNESERPDTLAANYYGNPQLWWMIADGNPEIMEWDNLSSGTVIRIPSIA